MAQPVEGLPSHEEVVRACGSVRRALRRTTRAQKELEVARAERDRTIADLRVLGWTIDRVAEFTELSVGTICRIDREQGVKSARVTTKG